MEIFFVDVVVEKIKDFGGGNLNKYSEKIHEDFEGVLLLREI